MSVPGRAPRLGSLLLLLLLAVLPAYPQSEDGPVNRQILLFPDTTQYFNSGVVNLRSRPAVDAPIVARGAYGEAVEILERLEAQSELGGYQAYWYRVRYNTTEAYVWGGGLSTQAHVGDLDADGREDVLVAYQMSNYDEPYASLGGGRHQHPGVRYAAEYYWGPRGGTPTTARFDSEPIIAGRFRALEPELRPGPREILVLSAAAGDPSCDRLYTQYFWYSQGMFRLLADTRLVDCEHGGTVARITPPTGPGDALVIEVYRETATWDRARGHYVETEEPALERRISILWDGAGYYLR